MRIRELNDKRNKGKRSNLVPIGYVYFDPQILRISSIRMRSIISKYLIYELCSCIKFSVKL